jgi:phosphoribosylformylglycinamidine cyclo-ligase
MSYSESYRKAGVDLAAGYRAVELLKRHVERTSTHGVLSPVGGFGGLFAPDIAGMQRPVLVAGTDGVGTKLKLAFLMDRHDTIGIDCVAMCVNDVLCCGAEPLFFLDYIACGKNVPERIAAIVSGVAEGCVQAGCALIGGETAEMPQFYPPGEYDIAGFAVGIVDQPKMFDPSRILPGDAVLALPSSGLHSNGYSLVRRVFRVGEPGVLTRYMDELGSSLGDALLTPTRIYVTAMNALKAAATVKAAAHITGGGFFENIPRALPKGYSAKIDVRALRIPAIFRLLQQCGNIPDGDMFNTFNMGVGMAMVVAAEEADAALRTLQAAGEEAYIMGEIVKGGEGVLL